MKYISILFTVLLAGCSLQKTADTFELEIVTKEINCLNVKLSEYSKYMKLDTIAVENSRTILTYKLTNNSNKTYYFNFDGEDYDFKDKYISINKALVAIYDSNGIYQKPRLAAPSKGNETKMLYSTYLGYKYRGLAHNSNKNFIIHPHETLYFEWFIVLPFGNMLEDINYSVELDSKKKYYAEILVHSDSTNYKKTITRTDLKTIQKNSYEVFNGTIKSKNKIPIIFK